MPSPQSNSLQVDFCGLNLNTPIVLLSGCVGFGEEYTRVEGYSNADVGAVVLKGTTHEARLGNPPHRVCETPMGAHPGGLYVGDLPVDGYGEDYDFWVEARAASRVTTTRREFVATRERERIALEAIATLLGVLLHKLRLLEELDRAYGELRRIRDGGTRLQRLEALEKPRHGRGRRGTTGM